MNNLISWFGNTWNHLANVVMKALRGIGYFYREAWVCVFIPRDTIWYRVSIWIGTILTLIAFLWILPHWGNKYQKRQTRRKNNRCKDASLEMDLRDIRFNGILFFLFAFIPGVILLVFRGAIISLVFTAFITIIAIVILGFAASVVYNLYKDHVYYWLDWIISGLKTALKWFLPKKKILTK